MPVRLQVLTGHKYAQQSNQYFSHCSYSPPAVSLCKWPQCHACCPREKNNIREVEDEIAKPTGPLFTDCDAAADAECCRQLHYFPVSAASYYSESVTWCAYVCLALGRLGEDGSCMPTDPECINWQTQESWPKKGDGSSRTMSVGTYCMCGPLDRSKLDEQSARVVQGPVRPADTTTSFID